MTQHDRIRDYMKRFGSITTMEAFADLSITKLTTRISEMRAAGEDIRSEKITTRNRLNEIVHYNRYYLA